MPGEILNKVDVNKDFNITAKELNDFLDGKRADMKPTEENLKLLIQQLTDAYESDLEKSFTDTLKKAQKDIVGKNTKKLTESEKKILQLYAQIFPNTEVVSESPNEEVYEFKDGMLMVNGKAIQLDAGKLQQIKESMEAFQEIQNKRNEKVQTYLFVCQLCEKRFDEKLNDLEVSQMRDNIQA